MSSKVTHLIAAAATGEKYRYATTFALPVLDRSWVHACWERREDPACMATNDDVLVRHTANYVISDITSYQNLCLVSGTERKNSTSSLLPWMS
jgi:hypothetical protein